jgi:alkanesulfonate monooxygenase SsuD/methylene tetrahydromethanopterin reductase-like flavin-dependent oxidoreductase (luciferase family)
MTHGIKTWTFEFHVIPGRGVPDYEDQQLVQQTFDRNLRRLVELEGYGFEGVFFSEHHFLNSLSPVPNLLIAAVAKMTTRFRLGVMGNVLPFHQPWRLAEELATLDYLTDGRLEIGAASGIPPEFLFVGMPPNEIRPRYGEILEYLGLATANKHVSFHGEYYDFEDIPSMPRPRTEARRRHWMTIYSPETAAGAARRDYKVCTGYQPSATAKVAFDAYRDACADAGRDCSPDDIGVRRQVLICESDAQAEDLHAELLANDQQRIQAVFAEVFARVQRTTAAEQMAPSQQSSGVMDAAAVPGGGSQPAQGRSPVPGGGGGLNIDAASEYLHGSPSTVAEKIIEQLRFIGAGNILQYHAQSMTEDELDLHYKLFSTIVPVLASANVSADA